MLDVDAARLSAEESVDPGVDLDARHRRMGEPDHVRWRIEVARARDVLRPRLIRALEIRVAGLADLDEQRVEVGSAGICDELIHLGGRLDPVVERVDPEGAVLGLAQRDRSGRWGGCSRDGGEAAQQPRGGAPHQARAKSTWLRAAVSMAPVCWPLTASFRSRWTACPRRRPSAPARAAASSQ